MNFTDRVRGERNRLVSRIEHNENRRLKLPLGRLNITESNGYFYWRVTMDAAPGQKKESFHISRKDEKYAAALAEATKCEMQIKADRERIEVIDELLKNYNDNESVFDYKYAHEYERLLSTRNLIPEADSQEWLERHYIRSTNRLYEKSVMTDSGLLVRSKSEAGILNVLHEAGIAYFYEPVLQVSDNKQLVPDVIFIHPIWRNQCIWQHFGLMDDPKYALKNIEELKDYYQAGWKLGVNLFVTAGTREHPFTQTDARDFLIMISDRTVFR